MFKQCESMNCCMKISHFSKSIKLTIDTEDTASDKSISKIKFNRLRYFIKHISVKRFNTMTMSLFQFHLNSGNLGK